MGNECPICLDAIGDIKQVITMECCKNQFHTSCIFKSFAHNRVCPMCRADHKIIVIHDTQPETVVPNYSILKLTIILFVVIFIIFMSFRYS